uniref:Uncharacterized protein n=1 Tax=Glossina austeni TaxID=7395 RepID=A0A1A9VG28_GLOAU
MELIPEKDVIKFFGCTDLDRIYSKNVGQFEGFIDESLTITGDYAAVYVRMHHRNSQIHNRLIVDKSGMQFRGINTFDIKDPEMNRFSLVFVYLCLKITVSLVSCFKRNTLLLNNSNEHLASDTMTDCLPSYLLKCKTDMFPFAFIKLNARNVLQSISCYLICCNSSFMSLQQDLDERILLEKVFLNKLQHETRSGQKINIDSNNIPNKYCGNTKKSLTNAIITGHGVSCCLSWKSTLALTTTIAKRKAETVTPTANIIQFYGQHTYDGKPVASMFQSLQSSPNEIIPVQRVPELSNNVFMSILTDVLNCQPAIVCLLCSEWLKNPENITPSSSSPNPASFLSSRPSQSSFPLSQKSDTESYNTTTNISPGSTLDVKDPSKKLVRLEGGEREIIISSLFLRKHLLKY